MIDITRYLTGEVSWSFLIAKGYTVEYDYCRNRVYLVKS